MPPKASLIRSSFNTTSRGATDGARVGLGGKGFGKGKTAKRHRYKDESQLFDRPSAAANRPPCVFRKVLRDNIQGITKPAIRRLARRGGVKRISGDIYEKMREVVKWKLELVSSVQRFLVQCDRSCCRFLDVVGTFVLISSVRWQIMHDVCAVVRKSFSSLFLSLPIPRASICSASFGRRVVVSERVSY